MENRGENGDTLSFYFSPRISVFQNFIAPELNALYFRPGVGETVRMV